ncbi:glycosyltransferase family 2 protein [bacterium]|nr:glycosyltransferase family 2 protein [bacterium]
MSLITKVAVVIVNWNRRKLLLEAVESCYTTKWRNLEVIVVDNGSSDGSSESVLEHYPDVVLIRNQRNAGFAIGSNQGLERALEDKSDFVLFLNNDATLAEDAISEMVSFLNDHPRVGAVAPYIFYYGDRDLIWFGGGVVSLWKGQIAHKYIREKFDSVKHRRNKCDYLTGCAFLIKAECIEQVGGFDTSMGIYSEDVDLSIRMNRLGWRLWTIPEARCYHRVSVSSGGELSSFKAFHRGRSNAIIVKRWAKFYEYPTLIIGGLIGGIAVSIKLLMMGRKNTISALWLGICKGLTGGAVPGRYEIGN